MLSCFSPDKKTLTTLPGQELLITAADVASILGVNRGGMDANSFLEYNYASARRNLAELLSSGFQKVSLSLTRAKSVLLSLHNADILTESEERAFIAALLLYSASTFLVPTSNSDRNNMDYRLICAVSHTINHQAVDWAAYTLRDFRISN